MGTYWEEKVKGGGMAFTAACCTALSSKTAVKNHEAPSKGHGQPCLRCIDVRDKQGLLDIGGNPPGAMGMRWQHTSCPKMAKNSRPKNLLKNMEIRIL